MKAHPKVTADPSTHVRSQQPRPSGFVLAMRRLAIGAAGLAVAVLAAAACVVSFDDLRALAMQAGARENFAYLYPAAFDALLVIALISFLLLGTARPLVRAQAGFVLLILLAAASWANVSMVMRFTIDPRLGAAIVGVTPWVMLLIGLWLLTLLIKHAQVRRAAYENGAEARDVVPFAGDDAAAEERRPEPAAADRPESVGSKLTTFPAAAPSAPGPQEPFDMRHDPPVSAAAATQPYRVPTPPSPATEPSAESGERPRQTEESAAPPADSPRQEPEAPAEAAGGTGGATDGEAARRSDEPAPATEKERPTAEAVTHEAEPADTRPAAEGAATPDTAAGSAQEERREHAADAPGETGGAANAPAQEHARPAKRPIQWGDLLRAPTGDVLVYPRPEQAGGQAEGAASAEGHAPVSAPETASREETRVATDWEPEETDAGPQETDASTDEAEDVTVETGIRVWPPATAQDQEKGEDLAGMDTQPYPHLRERSRPLPETADPAHGAAEADPPEHAAARSSAAVAGPTVPLSPPPSGRMRSTPTPPQD